MKWNKLGKDDPRSDFSLKDLTILKLPAPKMGRVIRTPNEYTVVASDFHFPMEDPAVCDILFQVCRELQPKAVVLNGDLPDLMALSNYPKDIKERWTLLEEQVAMHKFLFTLHEVLPKNTRIIETNANHSGEGRESRWRRFLSERCGEVADLPKFVAATGYREIWHPEWSRVEMADQYEITERFFALHGDVVVGKAGYSAMKMLEKWRANVIHGHTHRMGSSGYRVPLIGSQKEHQMRAFEGGCCCKLDAPYMSTTNWQNCISIINHGEGGNFGIEQVLIHQEKATIATLGGTYSAGG